MQGSNFRQNDEYFESLATEVAGGDKLEERVKAVTPMQLKSGQLAKFTYNKTRKDYTAVIASTPRAPYGHYTTANTRNLVVTAYLLEHYSSETVNAFLKALYASGALRKNKMVRYKPEAHNEYRSRMSRFWSNLMSKINLRVKSKTKLDSRNFRTFIAGQMTLCKVLT